MHVTGLEPVLSIWKQIMSLPLSTAQPYMLYLFIFFNKIDCILKRKSPCYSQNFSSQAGLRFFSHATLFS